MSIERLVVELREAELHSVDSIGVRRGTLTFRAPMAEIEITVTGDISNLPISLGDKARLSLTAVED